MKESNPLVSVGVASYNNSKFILETLNSIKNQTYRNIELIINDDGSNDGSKELVSNWLAENANIPNLYINSNVNLGICKSLNKIIENCSGDYVCLIGSDDVYLPEFISKRVLYMEGISGDGALCFSNTYLIDVSGVRVGMDYRAIPDSDIYEYLARTSQSLCKPFTYLIRRSTFEKIGNFDESLMYEDLDWILRVTAKLNVFFLDELDTEYRIVPGSLGSKLGTTEGLLSQRELFKKNLGVRNTCDKYFKKKIRRLAIIAYKNRLVIAKKIALTNLKDFCTILDFTIVVLVYIPLDIILPGKRLIRSSSKFIFRRKLI